MGNQTQFYNVLACSENRTLISNNSILSFGSNEEWKFGFSNFFFFFGYTVLDQVIFVIELLYKCLMIEVLFCLITKLLGCLARIYSLQAKIRSPWIYWWWTKLDGYLHGIGHKCWTGICLPGCNSALPDSEWIWHQQRTYFACSCTRITWYYRYFVLV